MRHFEDLDSRYPDCMDDDAVSAAPFMGADPKELREEGLVLSDGAFTLNGVLPLRLIERGEAYIAGFMAEAAGRVREDSCKNHWHDPLFWEGVLEYKPPKKGSSSFARVVVISEYRK